MTTETEFRGQLCWALDMLARWGESGDPHVKYEAGVQAKTALGELSREIS